MTPIEQIKAEIERLKELHRTPTFPGDKYEEGGVNGYQLALDKLLFFIESLEKEPKDPKTTFYVPNYNCEGIVDKSGWHFGKQNSLEKEQSPKIKDGVTGGGLSKRTSS